MVCQNTWVNVNAFHNTITNTEIYLFGNSHLPAQSNVRWLETDLIQYLVPVEKYLHPGCKHTTN